ncbi:MAG: hypothetical protein ACRC8S_11750 [Fimbriiglobus sp.]
MIQWENVVFVHNLRMLDINMGYIAGEMDAKNYLIGERATLRVSTSDAEIARQMMMKDWSIGLKMGAQVNIPFPDFARQRIS